ncbi:MAG: T9SS type A sorting domain-containing protein [Bacteroidota bacterium]
MKKTFTFLAIFVSFQIINAQVFVKADATGLADGSSWENAYTDLQAAIDASEAATEIWIAGGTYIAPSDASIYETYGGFRIDKSGLQIYGGFEGTESVRTDRDASANLTILSADIAQDDTENDFSQNKSDNLTRVLYIDSLLSETIVLSGLNFTGGNSVSDTELDYDWRSGGGVFSHSSVQISDCNFYGNFAISGAAINLFGINASESSISNCRFSNNLTTNPDGQGIVFLVGVASVQVRNCSFTDNTVSRGALYSLRCLDVDVVDCIFQNNANENGFGGATWNWNSINVNYASCEFRNNRANNGGVLYNDGREHEELTISFQDCLFEDNTANDFGGGVFYNWQGKMEVTGCTFRGNSGPNGGVMYNDGRTHERLTVQFENCLFEENESTDFGGAALYNWRAYYIVDQCEFRDNNSSNNAGCIYTSGDDALHEIKNSVFEENQAFGGWGGSITSYTNVRGSIENCRFAKNEANVSGGAVALGFKANVDISFCDFEENIAQFGGAIFGQNDTTAMTIDSCRFSQNSAGRFGGAVLLNAGLDLNIDRSIFRENFSDIGGAISTFIDSLIRPKVDVQNSTFAYNVATVQGGAINLFNTDARFNNCLFDTNIADIEGIGGAISNNGFDGHHSELMLINSTLAANVGTVAGGIAQFAGNGDSDSATLSLQNTIIANSLGTNYTNETNNAAARVLSFGGNLSSDETLLTHLTHTQDLNESDPLFVDEFFDYRLQEGSPAIDLGVEGAAVLPYDIRGDTRVGAVDAGAFEAQMVSSVEQVKQAFDLTLFPNPAHENLTVELGETWQGKIEVKLMDAAGKQIYSQSVDKQSNHLQVSFGLAVLPNGVYEIVVRQGKNRQQKQFVKAL